MMRTTVCFHASPNPVFSATMPSSSCFNGPVNRLAWAVWVSQPPISMAAMRGPSGARISTPAAEATAGNAFRLFSGVWPIRVRSLKPRSFKPARMAGPMIGSDWFIAAMAA